MLPTILSYTFKVYWNGHANTNDLYFQRLATIYLIIAQTSVKTSSTTVPYHVNVNMKVYCIILEHLPH